MIKKALTIIAILTYGSVIAGGDDRDTGPVEPIFDKVVVTEQDPDTMTLNDTAEQEVIGQSDSGVLITEQMHEDCKDKLNLSDANIEKFKKLLSSDSLYNTGPASAFGILFSPKRWKSYFDCVENH